MSIRREVGESTTEKVVELVLVLCEVVEEEGSQEAQVVELLVVVPFQNLDPGRLALAVP